METLIQSDPVLKQKAIQNLFKLVRLVSTKPIQIDVLLKLYNINILYKYKNVGDKTLFQYCVYHTNHIEMMDYLYDNGGYSEGDFIFSLEVPSKLKSIRSLDWFLQKDLIKPTISYPVNLYTYEFTKTEYDPIVFILLFGIEKYIHYTSKSKIKFRKTLFDWIKLYFDIYKKDKDNNSILDLYIKLRNRDIYVMIMLKEAGITCNIESQFIYDKDTQNKKLCDIGLIM
jgi:hypothetical protein